MVRKSCTVTGEVAVMDMVMVGVTTRARARAHAMAAASATDSVSGAAKRRRTGIMNQAVRFWGRSSCTQVGSNADRRLLSENSTSRLPAEENSYRCLNPSSDEETSVSCCSSYGSSVLEKDRLKVADLEDQDESAEVDASTSHFGTERRENNSSSSEVEEKEFNSMDSVAAELIVVVNSPPPLSKDELQLPSDSDEVDLFPEIEKQQEIVKPTEAEIEDFFTVMETNHLEHFKKRYNFDFVKEEPLEGRYEWRQRT